VIPRICNDTFSEAANIAEADPLVLSAVCCLLSAICYLLSAVWCLLLAACSLLLAACKLRFPFYCLLSAVHRVFTLYRYLSL
jgi:hypothetical protein